MKARQERERDLVALLINDRPALLALFKELKGLAPGDDVPETSGYDLVNEILNAEFKDPPGDGGEGQRWMDARSSM